MKKRNVNCHCFGTVCHDAKDAVRNVAVPSKVGGKTVLVRMSAECAHRHAEVRQDPAHVAAHIAAVVAALGRECDA